MRPVQVDLPSSGLVGKKLWMSLFVLLGTVNNCSGGVISSKNSVVLNRTRITDQTIEFFNKSSHPLEVRKIKSETYIEKQQNSCNRKIFIREYTLEEIPAKIDPGISLGDLVISGGESPSGISTYKTGVIARIGKLLNMLRSGYIQRLDLESFDMFFGLFPRLNRAKKFFNIGRGLTLNNVSPSFVNWLGNSYSFAKCKRTTFVLTLHSCPNIISLSCLDSLGFRTISKLEVTDMQQLQYINCRLLRTRQVTRCLTLTNLRNTVVSIETRQAIGGVGWNILEVNVSLWKTIFSMHHDVYIESVFLVMDSPEVTNIVDNSVSALPSVCANCCFIKLPSNVVAMTLELVKSILGFVCANFKNLCKVRVISFRGPLDKFIEFHKQLDPIYMPTLPMLTEFMIGRYRCRLYTPLYPLTTNVITISYPGVPEYDGDENENENEEATTLL
ncbi:hypothetical protein NEDG_02227 [Nematocida displodere]|uniref:Uncharacterized protein n=1 Tax=Nematocida displodere TaxID=1805483 RepID=A0A177EEN5_9MICR|nr:hypothetical protein NEDG_02227 [Nematocida displodere]